MAIVQHFAGTFSINSNIAGTGIDYLSGSFVDGVFGLRNGTGLVLTADGTFSSDVIDDLSPPRNFGLTFTNLGPALTTVTGRAAAAVNCLASGPRHNTLCGRPGGSILPFDFDLGATVRRLSTTSVTPGSPMKSPPGVWGWKAKIPPASLPEYLQVLA